jgi:hypothetical protein
MGLTRQSGPGRVGITTEGSCALITEGKLSMATDRDRQQKLRDAGVIVADELPPEYAAVVEGLTRDELDVIISVKKRLDEAGRVSGRPTGDVFFAP